MIHLGRLKDGSRKVLEIAEPVGFSEGEIKMQTIYQFEQKGTFADGKVMGSLKKTGVHSHEKIL